MRKSSADPYNDTLVHTPRQVDDESTQLIPTHLSIPHREKRGGWGGSVTTYSHDGVNAGTIEPGHRTVGPVLTSTALCGGGVGS